MVYPRSFEPVAQAVSLVQRFFLVRCNGAVRSRVSDAGQDVASRDLVVIKERLIGLVNGSRL